MRIIPIFLFIAVLVLISCISLGKKKFYAFLKVRKIKLKYYRSGYHLECSGDKLRSQISACLPDIPEDEITEELLATTTRQKAVDLKLTKLANLIEKDLPFELERTGFLEESYFLKEISQKELTLALINFIVFVRNQADEKIVDVEGLIDELMSKHC